MTNHFFIRQNDQVVLKCLVAQRKLYSRAKRWGYIPKVTVVLLVLIALVWQSNNSTAASWLLAIVSFIAWIIAFAGEMYIDVLRHKAARMQQFIDKEIFKEAFSAEELSSWRDTPLASEISEEMSGVEDSDVDKENVRNWYPDYSFLSPQKAVFFCQKENLRWDRKLRVSMMIVGLIFLFGFMGLLLLRVWNMKVCNALPTLMAGAGIFSVSVNVLVGLVFDCVRLTKINEIAAIVEKNLQGGLSIAGLLIDMQNKIYENRCKVVLVPDFFYKILRKRQQKSEDAITKFHIEVENRSEMC